MSLTLPCSESFSVILCEFKIILLGFLSLITSLRLSYRSCFVAVPVFTTSSVAIPRNLLLFSKLQTPHFKLFLLLDSKLFFVEDHFAPSCCFVELFSSLIATFRVILSALLRFKQSLSLIGNCFVAT